MKLEGTSDNNPRQCFLVAETYLQQTSQQLRRFSQKLADSTWCLIVKLWLLCLDGCWSRKTTISSTESICIHWFPFFGKNCLFEQQHKILRWIRPSKKLLPTRFQLQVCQTLFDQNKRNILCQDHGQDWVTRSPCWLQFWVDFRCLPNSPWPIWKTAC